MSQGPLSTLRRTTDSKNDGKFNIVSLPMLEKLQKGVVDEMDYELISNPPKELLLANSKIGDPADFFFTYDVVTGSWVLLRQSVKTKSLTAPPEVAAAIAAKMPLALRNRVVYCYFTKAWFIVDSPQPFAPPELYYVPNDSVVEMGEDLPAAIEVYSYKSDALKPEDAPAWIMRPEAHTALYVHRGQFCTFDRVSCTWQSETSDPLYQTLLSGRRGVKVHLADSNALSAKLLATLLTTVFKDLATGIGAPLEQVLAAAASIVAGGTKSIDTSVSTTSPRTPAPSIIDKPSSAVAAASTTSATTMPSTLEPSVISDDTSSSTDAPSTTNSTASKHPQFITNVMGTTSTDSATDQLDTDNGNATAQTTATSTSDNTENVTQEVAADTKEPVNDKADGRSTQAHSVETKQTTVSTIPLPPTTKVDRKEAWV